MDEAVLSDGRVPEVTAQREGTLWLGNRSVAMHLGGSTMSPTDWGMTAASKPDAATAAGCLQPLPVQ